MPKKLNWPRLIRFDSVYEEIPKDAPKINYVGQWNATVTARCVKCSYEVDRTAVQKDRRDSKGDITKIIEERMLTKFRKMCL